MQLRSEALPDIDGVWVRPARNLAGTTTGCSPSLDSARRIEARPTAYAEPTTLDTHPHAAHRVVLPEATVATGGTDGARRHRVCRSGPGPARVARDPARPGCPEG